MSEEKMLDAVQAALTHRGIDDKLIAAGQFMPRGHTGGVFLGTIVGDTVGGVGGDVGEVVGAVAGGLAGARVADERRGLPAFMLIGVSEMAVYGFAGRSRRKEPDELAFQVSREGLSVKVHQRANVRVLELIDDASGSKIELEGNRLPITHSKDVIDVLRAS
jgi:uncharacterized protein YcfJ